jgi:hypothetical protein
LHEVLVQCGHLSSDRAENLAERFRGDEELAEHLLESGALSEDELCKVLSLQSGLASAQVDCRKVTRRIARSLPAHIEKKFGLVPFELESGRLLLAAARIPPVNALEEIRNHTPLELELHLITRNNYQELRRVLYG